MKFAFVVKMVGKNGSQSHRAIGEIDVTGVAELAEILNRQRFIVITRFHEEERKLVLVGPEILSREVIAKVREYKDFATRYGEE